MKKFHHPLANQMSEQSIRESESRIRYREIQEKIRQEMALNRDMSIEEKIFARSFPKKERRIIPI